MMQQKRNDLNRNFFYLLQELLAYFLPTEERTFRYLLSLQGCFDIERIRPFSVMILASRFSMSQFLVVLEIKVKLGGSHIMKGILIIFGSLIGMLDKFINSFFHATSLFFLAFLS